MTIGLSVIVETRPINETKFFLKNLKDLEYEFSDRFIKSTVKRFKNFEANGSEALLSINRFTEEIIQKFS